MSQVPRVELSGRWWKSARPAAFKDKTLDQALQAYEAAEESFLKYSDADSAEVFRRAIKSCSAAVDGTLTRVEPSERDLLKALKQLDALLSKRLRAIEDEVAQPEEEGDESVENAVFHADRLRALMKMLPKKPMAFAFCVGPDGPMLLLDRTRKGTALMTKLKEETGAKAATYGMASAAGKDLTLEVQGPALSGLEKKVREYLRDNGPMPCSHVLVREEGAQEPAEDVAEDVDQGGGKRAPEEEPLLNMPAPLSLAGSVGAGGKNQRDDVVAAQIALIRRTRAGLEIDGICGPMTIAAIRAFQKSIGFQNPDGRIDPSGKTEAALNGAKSEDYAPSTGSGYGGGGGGGGGYGGGGGGGGGGYGSGGGHAGGKYEEEVPGYGHEPKQKAGWEEGGGGKAKEAADYARRIAKAVSDEKKKVEQKVKVTLDRLTEAERKSREWQSEQEAERARELRERVEKIYEQGKESVRGIKDAAEKYVQDQTDEARKRLEDAARQAGLGFKDTDRTADEGISWVESEWTTEKE